MKIRKLEKNDSFQLDELIDITESTLSNNEFWLPLKETAKNHFFDDEWTEFYGMFDGEKLIGAAALFFDEYEYGESLAQLNISVGRVAEIGRAMVHPDYRGNNFLYSINLQLKEIAEKKSIEMLLATIHPDNIASRKSFEKLGMQKQCTYKKSQGFMRDIFTLYLNR